MAAHMQEYFIALVDGTVEASVKYVREYVHAYLSDMLEEARSQIHSYGQSFSATMQAALITRQQGWSSLACLPHIATCTSHHHQSHYNIMLVTAQLCLLSTLCNQKMHYV